MHQCHFGFCQPMCRSSLLVIFCLAVFVVNIEPVGTLRISELTNIQLEDFSFIGEKFQLIFDRIKIAINRFRCPKGWKRLGGSCYLLSSTVSLSSEVNATCYRMHSNRSHLARINNPIELFYTAHILMRENLTSMMIEIDPTLLTGKKFTDKLIGDQDAWDKMKENLRKLRRKYSRFKEKVLDRLNASHVKVLPPTRQIRPNDTSIEIEELDYSSDTTDPFEDQENHRSVCQQVEWNVLHPHSNVFLLTTYLKSEEVVCSISDIVADYRYHHLCELVLDFCFANILCGTYGRCVNTLHGFTCACNFFFDGFFCEKMSRQGKEAFIAFFIAFGLWIFSWKKTRKFIGKLLINRSHNSFFRHVQRNQNEQIPMEPPNAANAPRRTFYEQLKDAIMQAPVQDCQFYRMLIVVVSAIVILIVLFVTTTWIHLAQPYYNIDYETMNMTLFYNKTAKDLARCEYIGNHTVGNMIFLPWTLILTVIFSYSVKRKKYCLNCCDGRPACLLPIEPFRTANRFSAAAVFGIIAFEVLKIFEKILFNINTPNPYGVIHMLVLRIATIILLGMRYYPLLASLQLKSILVRFFSFLYILGNIAYTIMHEGFCTGYLPLPGKSFALEQAILRIDLGTWFVIYGLIRNIPHYFFLSFLGAELFARFVYDSLWLPYRKNESIWQTKYKREKEFENADEYVGKLFERNAARVRLEGDQRTLPEKNDQRNFLMKIPNSIWKSIVSLSEDESLFTNMTICTYTVAVVFLYYLACTFIFLYITKTGHLTVLEEMIEQMLNIELDERLSLKKEIVISAIVTSCIFIVQLIIGIQNFKRHKLQLHKRAGCEEIPSLKSLPKNKIASNALHYPGFLVAYMAWGFTICFHCLLIIAISFRMISFNNFYLQIALTLAIPIIIIYLVKIYSMSCCSQYAFTVEVDDDDNDSSQQPARLNLNNPHWYVFLLYITFFADCFIGVTSCIIRFAKGFFLNILFMARLDCSFLGRPIEKEDAGFSAYVSYLYVEVSQTHPVLVAFCGQINDEIIKRRGPQDGYDECCLAVNQSSSDDGSDEVIESRIPQQTLQQPQRLTTASNVEIPELMSQNNIVETTALVHSSHTASENNVSGLASDETTNRPPVIPPRDDISLKSEGNSSSKRKHDSSCIPRDDVRISLASNEDTRQNMNDYSNTSTARSSRPQSEVSNDHQSSELVEDETRPMLVQLETGSSVLSKRSKSSKSGFFSRMRSRIPFLKSHQESTENRIELASINVVSDSSEQPHLPQNLQQSLPNIADSFLRRSNAIELPDDQEKNGIRSAVTNLSYASVEAIPTLASNEPPVNRTKAPSDNVIKTESLLNKTGGTILRKVSLLPAPPTYYKMTAEEKKDFQRRKRAIFRWCLLRTLIRNCNLSAYRKYYTKLALVKFAEEYNYAAENAKTPSIEQEAIVESPQTIEPPLITYLRYLKQCSAQENHYPTSPAEFFAIQQRERVLGFYECDHGSQPTPITRTSEGFVPEITFEFHPVTPEQIPATHSEASVAADPTATRSKNDRTATSIPATPSSVYSSDFRSVPSSQGRTRRKKKRFQYSYDISPPRTLLSRAASPTNLSRETHENIRLPTPSPFTYTTTGRTAQRTNLTSTASERMTATAPDASQSDTQIQQLPTIPEVSTLSVKVEVHHVTTPDT